MTTPGHWTFSLDEEERGAMVFSSTEHRYSVCNCYPEDAALISAAPDLFAFAQEFIRLEHSKEPISSVDFLRLEELALAAIAKATS